MAVLTEAQLKAKLIIDPPSELRFRGPFTTQVITTLKLTNPSEYNILFKIKTTAPKRYCVRPNFGCVKAHASTEVEICLQPFNFDPFEKNKHKFMVQSVLCPPIDMDEPSSYFNIWKELPTEHFMDAKLKCVFEIPDDEASPAKITKVETSSSPPQIKNEEKVCERLWDLHLLNHCKQKLEHSAADMEPLKHSDMLTDELKNLRGEISKLRKENLTLKEQVIQFRSPLPRPVEVYTPVNAEKQIPMFYIAIAIAAVIFGILFGKFLL